MTTIAPTIRDAFIGVTDFVFGATVSQRSLDCSRAIILGYKILTDHAVEVLSLDVYEIRSRETRHVRDDKRITFDSGKWAPDIDKEVT